jgi:hypothetical protein
VKILLFFHHSLHAAACDIEDSITAFILSGSCPCWLVAEYKTVTVVLVRLGKFLLAFATTVILGFGPCRTHDHIFLSDDSWLSCETFLLPSESHKIPSNWMIKVRILSWRQFPYYGLFLLLQSFKTCKLNCALTASLQALSNSSYHLTLTSSVTNKVKLIKMRTNQLETSSMKKKKMFSSLASAGSHL